MAAPSRTLIAALVLLAGACKPAMSATEVAVADDIDAIERAVSERDGELAAQGVVVAYRDVPRATEPGAVAAGPEPTDTPPTEPEPITDEAPVAPDEADAPALHSAPPEPAPNMAKDDAERESGRSRRDARRRSLEGRRAAEEAPSRCERLCGLADSTCGLRDRICSLAGRHFGDPRYAAACRRAEDQCAAVREQCEACAA